MNIPRFGWQWHSWKYYIFFLKYPLQKSDGDEGLTTVSGGSRAGSSGLRAYNKGLRADSGASAVIGSGLLTIGSGSRAGNLWQRSSGCRWWFGSQQQWSQGPQLLAVLQRPLTMVWLPATVYNGGGGNPMADSGSRNGGLVTLTADQRWWLIIE